MQKMDGVDSRLKLKDGKSIALKRGVTQKKDTFRGGVESGVK